MIEIVEVKSKSQMNKFAAFPVKLYKDCPYYVPSLRSDEKATFNPKKNFSLVGNKCKAFLCYKDKKLVGRIAGLINYKDNELTGKKMIRFSRFECVDDIEVFKALLKAVAQFGKENGMSEMHGPWGFNDTDREGMLTFGFDKVSTYSTNYSYEYFYKNMEKLGFDAESKWLERKFTIPEMPYERIVNIAKKLKAKLSLRDVAEEMSVKKIIKQYGYKLFDTVNESYAHLDGYVPIEGKAIDNVLSQFGTIVNKRYISVLVDKNDEVAGFAIVLPSIAKPLIKNRGKLFPFGFIGVLKAIKKPKVLEMALIGVKHRYKNSGLNSIMIARIMQNIIEDGIKEIESNPNLETNLDIIQQWKFAETEVIKKRQTYKKGVDEVIDM